jgi:hypothetical protein
MATAYPPNWLYKIINVVLTAEVYREKWLFVLMFPLFFFSVLNFLVCIANVMFVTELYRIVMQLCGVHRPPRLKNKIGGVRQMNTFSDP